LGVLDDPGIDRTPGKHDETVSLRHSLDMVQDEMLSKHDVTGDDRGELWKFFFLVKHPLLTSPSLMVWFFTFDGHKSRKCFM
jgi:hypothetical protein